MVIYNMNLRNYVCSLLMSSGFKVGVNLLLLRGIYSPQERVDGLDSQGQLFCKEGSGLFCSHNLEMVEQQTFYMLYYQHSWASSTSTECHVLPLILTKNASAEILWGWIVAYKANLLGVSRSFYNSVHDQMLEPSILCMLFLDTSLHS